MFLHKKSEINFKIHYLLQFFDGRKISVIIIKITQKSKENDALKEFQWGEIK